MLKQWKKDAKDKENHDDEPPNRDGYTTDAPSLSSSTGSELPLKQGKLLLDATCSTPDITLPTHIELLNKSREKLEKMIDTLHQPLAGQQKKPRTYRDKAHKEYLSLTKRLKTSPWKVPSSSEMFCNSKIISHSI